MFGSPLTSFVDLCSENLQIEDWFDGGRGDCFKGIFQFPTPGSDSSVIKLSPSTLSGSEEALKVWGQDERALFRGVLHYLCPHARFCVS